MSNQKKTSVPEIRAAWWWLFWLSLLAAAGVLALAWCPSGNIRLVVSCSSIEGPFTQKLQVKSPTVIRGRAASIYVENIAEIKPWEPKKKFPQPLHLKPSDDQEPLTVSGLTNADVFVTSATNLTIEAAERPKAALRFKGAGFEAAFTSDFIDLSFPLDLYKSFVPGAQAQLRGQKPKLLDAKLTYGPTPATQGITMETADAQAQIYTADGTERTLTLPPGKYTLKGCKIESLGIGDPPDIPQAIAIPADLTLDLESFTADALTETALPKPRLTLDGSGVARSVVLGRTELLPTVLQQILALNPTSRGVIGLLALIVATAIGALFKRALDVVVHARIPEPKKD